MSTRNIFQKICPACMSTLALDARQCACGHDFDHDQPDESLSSVEIRLKAEELYESYLAARAHQAATTAKTARAEFARDPANPSIAERLTAAADEARAAAAALAEQSARIAEMKKALPPAALPQHPAPAPATPKRKMTLVKSATPAAPARKTVLAQATSANAKVHSSRNKRAAKAVLSSVVENKRASTPLAAKPGVLPVEPGKSAKPKATATVPVPTLIRSKPQVVPSVLAEKPNPAFRKAQAAKAEKILPPPQLVARISSPKEQEKKPEKQGNSANVNNTAPSALSLSKAAPRLLISDKRECPNCTASVDSQLKRCRCGYEFPSSETLIPSLAMSDEERAEFAKLFGLP